MNEKIKQMPSSPESVTDNVSRLLGEIYKNMDIVEFYKKMVVFSKKIQKNQPDYHRYRVYHKLISSTLPEDTQDIIEEDFEGEDSIVAFLEGLLKIESQPS